MNMLTKAALLVAFGLSAPTVLAAQQGGERPAPPTAEMAADLGVSAALLESCSPSQPGERPAQGAQPERPSREEHEARLTEMATCLQQGDASITAQALDEVMQKYRPAAPVRG